jgi:protein TonB
MERATYLIGSDGRVTNCAVTGSSGWPLLDAAACTKLSARGKFKPATGEDGENVSGSYANAILWDIPEE